MQLILNTTKLVEMFVKCDDFMLDLEIFFAKHSLPNPAVRKFKIERLMSISEMMSITIFYHYSGFKCFKYYYNTVIKKLLKKYFPTTVLYD